MRLKKLDGTIDWRTGQYTSDVFNGFENIKQQYNVLGLGNIKQQYNVLGLGNIKQQYTVCDQLYGRMAPQDTRDEDSIKVANNIVVELKRLYRKLGCDLVMKPTKSSISGTEHQTIVHLFTHNMMLIKETKDSESKRALLKETGGILKKLQPLISSELEKYESKTTNDHLKAPEERASVVKALEDRPEELKHEAILEQDKPTVLNEKIEMAPEDGQEELKDEEKTSVITIQPTFNSMVMGQQNTELSQYHRI